MKIGFNSLPLQGMHNARGIGSYTRNLLTELKKKDVDIVEFTGKNPDNVDLIFHPYFDLFFRTLHISEIPTVVMVHDTMPLIFPKAYPAGIKGKINLIFQKKELKKAKFVITNSEKSKSDINKYLAVDKNKIFAIPLAAGKEFRVLPDQDKIKIKKKYHIPDQFILYVGDANFIKNLPFLIKGFSEVKKDLAHADLKLVLVGGVFLNKDLNHTELASLREVHALIKKNKLDMEVIMPGQVEINDLIGFYNLASLYIQPSLYEGFGIPVIEAMQSGCPVLSSSAGSLPEVGGQAALYFDPKNIEDLIGMIKKILKSTVMQTNLRVDGFKQAKQFNWKKTAEETINVFEKSLA